jgi:hypothetical protein
MSKRKCLGAITGCRVWLTNDCLHRYRCAEFPLLLNICHRTVTYVIPRLSWIAGVRSVTLIILRIEVSRFPKCRNLGCWTRNDTQLVIRSDRDDCGGERRVFSLSVASSVVVQRPSPHHHFTIALGTSTRRFAEFERDTLSQYTLLRVLLSNH